MHKATFNERKGNEFEREQVGIYKIVQMEKIKKGKEVILL